MPSIVSRPEIVAQLRTEHGRDGFVLFKDAFGPIPLLALVGHRSEGGFTQCSESQVLGSLSEWLSGESGAVIAHIPMKDASGDGHRQ